MKTRLFFLILIFCPVLLFGQQKQNATKQLKSVSRLDIEQIKVNLPETIQVKNITDINGRYSSIEKNMPWVVAILIGILSVFVNFWIAYRLRQSNEKNLQSQIESNERILQRQIEKSKEIQILEFKATIATKNRQDWLNEVRTCISEYLTCIAFITPDMKVHFKNDDFVKYVERAFLYKSKIELLLNEDKLEQAEVLKALNEFNMILQMNESEFDNTMFHKVSINLLNASRNLFKIHWSKIKELK